MDRDVEVTLYKRWRLRQGAALDEVVVLVRDQVVPHYRRLSTQVRLQLEQLDDEVVLAIQRWPSRQALAEAMEGADYAAWWSQYQPALRAWDSMLEFEAEWEGTVLVG